MAIIAPVIHSSKFAVSRGKFTAEASSFGSLSEARSAFGSPLFLRAAFDDACDVGFQIESAKTGKKVLFTLERVQHDREGDVVAWHFKSYRPSGSWSCTIFND